MQLISFAATVPQIEARQKWVTRRTGWRRLQPGQLVRAVDRLPRAGPWRTLAYLRIETITVEPLRALLDDRAYGRSECVLEGFPSHTPEAFIAVLQRLNPTLTINDDLTRILFSYACPNDTDGDGHCASRSCPWCGHAPR